MRRGRVLAGVALVTALMLAGCASGGKGKVRLSMQKMCNSAHGTWAGGTCNTAPKSPKSGQAMCEEQGGTYFADSALCQFDSEP